jgi:hypothetical protein
MAAFLIPSRRCDEKPGNGAAPTLLSMLQLRKNLGADAPLGQAEPKPAMALAN